MPNWITNIVEISNKSSAQDKLRKPSDIEFIALIRHLKGKNNGFDFNAVIPMPKDSATFKAKGSISGEDERHFGKENTWCGMVE